MPKWMFSKEELDNVIHIKSPNPKEELSMRHKTCSFMQSVGRELGMSQLSIATAILFWQRYYALQTVQTPARYSMATTSLFLAAKVDDAPKRLNDVVRIALKHQGNADVRVDTAEFIREREQVLMNELELLKHLGFDMTVDLPYRFLLTHFSKAGKEEKELGQIAWNFVNDSLRTNLSLRYPAQMIALGAIYLAHKRSHKIMTAPGTDKTWWEVFDVKMDQIEEICSIILSLYDLPKKQSSSNPTSSPSNSTPKPVPMSPASPLNNSSSSSSNNNNNNINSFLQNMATPTTPNTNIVAMSPVNQQISQPPPPPPQQQQPLLQTKQSPRQRPELSGDEMEREKQRQKQNNEHDVEMKERSQSREKSKERYQEREKRKTKERALRNMEVDYPPPQKKEQYSSTTKDDKKKSHSDEKEKEKEKEKEQHHHHHHHHSTTGDEKEEKKKERSLSHGEKQQQGKNDEKLHEKHYHSHSHHGDEHKEEHQLQHIDIHEKKSHEHEHGHRDSTGDDKEQQAKHHESSSSTTTTTSSSSSAATAHERDHKHERYHPYH